MARVDFQVRIDGNGRERFFIDHRECNIDWYVQEYVKVHAEMPTIPSWEKSKALAAEAKAKADAELAVETAKQLAQTDPLPSAEDFDEELKDERQDDLAEEKAVSE